MRANPLASLPRPRLPRPQPSRASLRRPHLRPRARQALVTVGTLLAATGIAVAISGPAPQALAVVVHGHGHHGTVLGWTSWYGSYHLGDLGEAWCIDHGLAAPDADFGYVPTELTGVDPSIRSALSWAAGLPVGDAHDAAARMLAFHDLMGAQYPFGRLNVDGLTPAHLDGFGGAEHAIIARAREIKAYGLAHGHLREPYRLEVNITEVPAGAEGIVSVALTDAGGHPVPGVNLHLAPTGALAAHRHHNVTDGAGVAWFGFRAGPGDNGARVHGTLPSTTPSTWAPTTRAAQRIVRVAAAEVDGTVAYRIVEPPPEPTTTTTTAPPPEPHTTTTTPPTPTHEPTTTNDTPPPPHTTTPNHTQP
ncbi:MAG: hypothetical protein JJU45_15935, partial [Acidimicrobiia bacterium]|nr:hypothetical protein [Acidimicrobiia bacterium]